jgi:hypothetical protein
MALENFANTLRDKNYKPSTIQLYVAKLEQSGVDLDDRGRVHQVVRGHIFGDLNGHTYRSLRLYERFLNKSPIRTMRSTKGASRLTARQACLKMKTRSDVRRAWWLMCHKGYAPSTATFYTKCQNKIDFNKNGRRARVALQDYDPGVAMMIDDPVVIEHCRNLSM